MRYDSIRSSFTYETEALATDIVLVDLSSDFFRRAFRSFEDALTGSSDSVIITAYFLPEDPFLDLFFLPPEPVIRYTSVSFCFGTAGFLWIFAGD